MLNKYSTLLLRSIIGPLALCFLLLGMTACNTMEGAGKDIESAGDAIKETARKTKKNM